MQERALMLRMLSTDVCCMCVCVWLCLLCSVVHYLTSSATIGTISIKTRYAIINPQVKGAVLGMLKRPAGRGNGGNGFVSGWYPRAVLAGAPAVRACVVSLLLLLPPGVGSLHVTPAAAAAPPLAALAAISCLGW